MSALNVRTEVIVKKEGNYKSEDEQLLKNIEAATEETQQIEKSSKNISKNIKNAFNKSSVVAWAKLIKDTINGLINVSKAQAQYTENLRLMRTAFADTADEAEKFVKQYSNVVGIDPSTFARQLGIFRQMADGMGITAQTADLLSTNLSKLQLEIHAFYRESKSLAEVGKDLQNAMAGNLRGLRSLGIVITSNTLQEQLYSLGINRTVASLTQAEKSILTYITVEKQMANANGALARSINSVTSQAQIFKEQIEIAKRQLGAFAQWLLQYILPVVNGVIMAFNELVGMLLTFLGIDASTSARESSQAFSSYANSLNDTAIAAENAKKGLRGFDKLNNITTPTSPSSSSIGGGTNIDAKLLAALDEYELKLSEIQNKAVEIKKAILGWLGFTEDENGELTWSADLLKDNILKTLKDIGNWLVKNWKTLLYIGSAILVILGIKDLFSVFKNSGDINKTSKATENFSKAAKKLSTALEILAVAVAALAILGGIAMVIHEVTELMKTMEQTGTSLSDVALLLGAVLGEVAIAVGILVAEFKSMDWQSIAGGVVILGGLALIIATLTGLINALSKSGMQIKDVLILVGGLLAELVITMGVIIALAKVMAADPLVLLAVVAIVGTIVALLLVLKETLPTILDVMGNFIEKVAPPLVKVLKTIGEVIVDIIHALGDILPPIINSVGNVFEKVFNGIANIISTVGNALTNILNTLKSLVIEVLQSILNFIRELGPAINIFVDNAITAITKLINFIVSGIEYLINTLIINSINSLIKAIKPILSLIGLGSLSKGLQQVSIPRFKPKLYDDGGFPKKGEIFIANEGIKAPEMVGTINGQPAVANNDQIVDGISIGVAKAIMATQKDTTVNITATGDASGLLDFITFEQNKKNRQYGLG